MCGIAGIWQRNGAPVDRARLARMADTIAHRGPDDGGFHFDDDAGIGLAHRRLSILDLTAAGHQPMVLQDRYWLTYNGEVYNYQALRRDLEALGHVFQTQTDSEVILHSYAEWGPDAVRKWNGMWALAIWDSQERTLFVSRDRLGVKPLYIAHVGETLAFASEIKALLALPGLLKQPYEPAIQDFLVQDLQDHGETTFFEGVTQVPPAHWMLFHANRGPERQRYWSIDPRRKLDLNVDEAAEYFKDLLSDAVRLRLISDVPVGTCLSGGLDSSAIVCAMTQYLGQGKVETFSARFREPQWDEGPHMQVVLDATGAIAHPVYPDPEDFIDDLDRLLWYQDEPFGSMSLFAQWSVMRAAKQAGVTVLLDGQGSDEMFAGYGFWGAYWADLLAHGRWGELWASWHARTAVDGRPMPQQWRSTLGGFRQHGTSGFGRLNGILHDYLTRRRLPALLHWEDRNSMAFSREARVPFLDYRLVEFAFALSDECKLHDGWDKALLRKSGILPEPIARRKDKMGFVTPQEGWMTGPLAEFVRVTLERRTTPYATDERIPLWRRFILERWFQVNWG
jgi:asparagine synthase (glutamine-hydrolysing)